MSIKATLSANTHKRAHTYREREREENSNSKTLILKDSSVRSIWTYLTASPCYTTNTNKHDYTTNIIIITTSKQLINTVSDSSYKRAKTSERERQRQADRQTER